MDTFRDIFRLLTPKEKLIAGALFVFGLAVSGLEVAQLGLLYPLIGVLASPEVIDEIEMAQRFFEITGAQTTTQKANVLLLMILLVGLSKGGLSLAILYWQSHLIASGSSRVGEFLNRLYLFAPISMHLGRHSAENIRNVRNLGPMAFGATVPGALMMLNGCVTALVIGSVLLLINPHATLAGGLVVGGLVYLQQRIHGKNFAELGEAKLDLARLIHKQLFHSFEAIKETQLLRRQQYFDDSFKKRVNQELAISRSQAFLTNLPGAIYEIVLVVGVVLVVFIVINTSGEGILLAELAVAIAAAYRFLPAVSRISIGLNNVRSGAPAVRRLLEEMDSFRGFVPDRQTTAEVEPIPFERFIRFVSVSYQYEGAAVPSLDGVSFEVAKGECIGIVGESGAGKSTLASILLGFLEPTGGQVFVDDEAVFPEKERWQRHLGYIPQQIVIADESARKNVAFGMTDEEIDEAKLRKAISLAQLEEFVESLPEGLATPLGERGKRLSGGQIQRIGIARALYHEPDVLVLDEATSALDSATERRVGDAIFEVAKQKTVFIIAHRLKTLERCDRLIFLDGGTLRGVGSFLELRDSDEKFAAFLHHAEFKLAGSESEADVV